MATVRLNEAGLRRIVRKIVAEQAIGGRVRGSRGVGKYDLDKAVAMIKAAGPDATMGELEKAKRILASTYNGSPTPSQDIASYLEGKGIDPDMAFDIGDDVEMNYMGGGSDGDYGYGM